MQLCVAASLSKSLAEETSSVSDEFEANIAYDVAREEARALCKRLGSSNSTFDTIISGCLNEDAFKVEHIPGQSTTTILTDMSLNSPCSGIILFQTKVEPDDMLYASLWNRAIAFYIDDTCPLKKEYHIIDPAQSQHYIFERLNGLNSLEMELYKMARGGKDNLVFIRIEHKEITPLKEVTPQKEVTPRKQITPLKDVAPLKEDPPQKEITPQEEKDPEPKPKKVKISVKKKSVVKRKKKDEEDPTPPPPPPSQKDEDKDETTNKKSPKKKNKKSE